MAFGIDTQQTRLDLLPSILPGGDFARWNGNTGPVFAGRTFLIGDNQWSHGEATNSLTEPDRGHYPLGANDPSPDHPENLTLLVPLIAPIQAAQSANQRLVGDRGRLFGAIDADAICRRVVATILAGELALSEAHVMQVWLTVDPTVPFSDDYWAGWANTVNTFPLSIISNGEVLAQVQPLRAAILCDYVAGADQKLRPDHQVTDTLAVPHRGLNTSVHGFWANFTLWDNAPAGLVANGDPLFDWSRFDPPTAPILWRVAHGFAKPDGTPAGVAVSVDSANPQAEPLSFMLTTWRWQPNIPTLQNVGFIKEVPITAAQIACLQQTQMPEMKDNNWHANAGHFVVPAGDIKFIGRYLRPGGAPNGSVTVDEVQRLNDADFRTFTIWEGARRLTGMGVAQPVVQDDDTPVKHGGAKQWGDFNQNSKKHIFYFNPDPDGNPATKDDAGTLDATEAFDYCHRVLKQPPNTPVFFSIDFDPYDLHDASALQPYTGTPPEPANWPHNWPALPSEATREDWIRKYFTNVRAVRDTYYTQTGRYYLIGVYAVGKALKVLYNQGIVSYFWQAGSSGHTGSAPPSWPWSHVNRWQYQGNVAPICGIVQPDPDADWGDGGLWSLDDPLSAQLDQLDRLGVVFAFKDLDELVVPPPPPAPAP